MKKITLAMVVLFSFAVSNGYAEQSIIESFENLSIGLIDGQGNWTSPPIQGWPDSIAEVVSSPTHNGSRALHLNRFSSTATYTINSPAAANTIISFWYREQFGFGTNDTGNNMSLRNAITLSDGYNQHLTYVNICHAGTGHRSLLMTADPIGNGSCINGVGDMTEGNWYFIEVEYDFGNQTARARVDGGNWCSKINLRVNGGSTGSYITSFSPMSVWDNPPQFWFDDIGISTTFEATDFVYPVLGISQTDPLTNNKDPLVDGWAGKGVGQHSAADGHLGQDYYLKSGNSAGMPVFAVANGEIVEVLNGPGRFGWCDDDDHGWGPVVVIRHNLSSGFKISSSAIKDPASCGTDLNPTIVYSLYGHLSKESIKDLYKGQIVSKGQQIGVVGQYGTDLISWTTNHLHFELKDQWAFDSEGTWYTNRSHDGVCPEPTTYMCSAREIKGVGTGYSHVLGFAPHRYIPNSFLLSNMINPPQTLTVSSDTNSSFTSVQDAYNSMTKNGQSLQMQAQVFSENLKFTNNLTVLLKGGYNSNYQTNSGWTTIFGSLTINSGTVDVDRICIQ